MESPPGIQCCGKRYGQLTNSPNPPWVTSTWAKRLVRMVMGSHSHGIHKDYLRTLLGLSSCLLTESPLIVPTWGGGLSLHLTCTILYLLMCTYDDLQPRWHTLVIDNRHWTVRVFPTFRQTLIHNLVNVKSTDQGVWMKVEDEALSVD